MRLFFQFTDFLFDAVCLFVLCAVLAIGALTQLLFWCVQGLFVRTAILAAFTGLTAFAPPDLSFQNLPVRFNFEADQIAQKAILEDSPLPAAAVAPPIRTFPVTISWTGHSGDAFYIVEWGTNSHAFLWHTNISAWSCQVMLDTSARYWYVGVKAASVFGPSNALAYVSEYSAEARQPQWPPNIFRISLDRWEAVTLERAEGFQGPWVSFTNFTGTNLDLPLPLPRIAGSFRAASTSAAPALRLTGEKIYIAPSNSPLGH